MRINNKKKKEINNKITINILIILFIIIPISYIFIYNTINKPSGKENITTKLNTDSDFLQWFIDFDNLYNKKINSPKYSLTKDSFQKIYNLLNNNNETNIYFKNNTYYIDNNITIELDVNTRSFRYTKYENNQNTSNKDNNKLEILEVKLLNGKYYIQIINKEYLYKITLNHKQVKNKKYKNKNNSIILENSIFNNKEFNW